MKKRKSAGGRHSLKQQLVASNKTIDALVEEIASLRAANTAKDKDNSEFFRIHRQQNEHNVLATFCGVIDNIGLQDGDVLAGHRMKKNPDSPVTKIESFQLPITQLREVAAHIRGGAVLAQFRRRRDQEDTAG